MHIYHYMRSWLGEEVNISIIHVCILKFKSNITTLRYAGNKFLHSGLEWNKYDINKFLNHATLNDAVHYATLENTDLTIDQETIQPAQTKISSFKNVVIVLTSTGLMHLNDFLLDHEIVNLGPVAPGASLRTFQESTWHQRSWSPQLVKKILGVQTS